MARANKRLGPIALRLAALALLAAIAGCYSTSVPSVPCTTTAGCPTGQSCDLVTGACTAAVSSCTVTQVVCGGACSEASQCLQCLNGICIGSADAAKTTLTADKDDVVADGASKVTFAAKVMDANGNAIPGVAVTASASGAKNTLAPATGTTDMNGGFTFTLTTTDAEAKTITLGVTSPSATFSKTLTATFIAGPPVAAQSAISSDASSITASSGASAATITVSLGDQFGNPCGGLGVAFAATGSATFAEPTATNPDAMGTATSTLSSTAAAQVSVSAAIGPAGASLFTLSLGNAITVAPAEPDPSTSSLIADRNNVIADGAAVITYTATLLDAFGNPVPLYAFTVSASGARDTLSASSASTDAAGVASFTLASKSAGTQVVGIAVALGANELGFNEQVSSTFIAGPPSSALSTLTSDRTTVPADGATAATLTATILDANSNPIAGIPVQFKSNGAALGAAVTTNNTGVASTQLASTQAGARTITGDIGPAGSPLFTLPANALTLQFLPGTANATQSLFTANSDHLVADNASLVTFTATIKDINGNPIRAPASRSPPAARTTPSPPPRAFQTATASSPSRSRPRPRRPS